MAPASSRKTSFVVNGSAAAFSLHGHPRNGFRRASTRVIPFRQRREDSEQRPPARGQVSFKRGGIACRGRYYLMSAATRNRPPLLSVRPREKRERTVGAILGLPSSLRRAPAR